MSKHILTVLRYFSHFSYAPSFDEIYTFFPQKISKKNLRILLGNEAQKGRILRIRKKNAIATYGPSPGSNMPYSLSPHPFLYTLPQYSILLAKSEKLKAQSSIQKMLIKLQRYFSFLRVIPLIRFVGITGASALQGVRENDDVDLCIVARNGSLWTTRFIVIILAKLLGIHGGMGVCLNLFFDETDLAIRPKKQNSYIAHELLQMKSVIDKNNLYAGFIAQNKWIASYYPNAFVHSSKLKVKSQKVEESSHYPLHPLPHALESLLKSLQLILIRRNKVLFYISPTQLWLFKNDYEKILKRRGLVL